MRISFFTTDYQILLYHKPDYQHFIYLVTYIHYVHLNKWYSLILLVLMKTEDYGQNVAAIHVDYYLYDTNSRT